MAKAISLDFDARFGKAVSETDKLVKRLEKAEQQAKGAAVAAARLGRNVEHAGKKGQESFAGPGLGNLQGYLTGMLSIGAAVAMITRSYQTWLENIREVSAETRKAANEMIAFAALQEGGTKAERVRRAADLGMRYGITGRGAVWDIIQAMQSAPGRTFETGMKAAETIFAARQVGIPLETGKGIEAVAAVQGVAPGDALRWAFAAGQASVTTPAVVAKAGPAMPFWKDPQLMMASAAILSGVFPERLEVYTRQAGMGLGMETAAAQARKGQPGIWERLGVTEATELERLQALRGAGLTTTEKLFEAGFTEQRQRTAVAVLVQNVDAVRQMVQTIQTQARPGLFGRQRAGIEAEIPITGLAREADIVAAMYREQLAFGVEAEPAAVESLNQQVRGLAMRRLGWRRGVVGARLQDAEGRATEFGTMRLFLRALLSPVHVPEEPFPEAPASPWRVMDRLEDEMNRIFGELRAIEQNTHGGPELVSPDGPGNASPVYVE